jgi:hypothetical protein
MYTGMKTYFFIYNHLDLPITINSKYFQLHVPKTDGRKVWIVEFMVRMMGLMGITPISHFIFACPQIYT